MDDNNDTSIFIFYTASSDFNIESLPNGWKWIGSGLAYPINKTEIEPPTKYEREIQFMGPKESREEVKFFLDEKLNRFKEEGIIQFYHIQNQFLPIPV